MDSILAEPELSDTMPPTEEPSTPWADWGKHIRVSMNRTWIGDRSGDRYFEFRCGCAVCQVHGYAETPKLTWYRRCQNHRRRA